MNSPDEAEETIAMVRESAAGIANRQDLNRVRALRFSLPGFDRGVWSEMCAMGWTGLRVPEARGGAGLSLAAYCALAQELGAALTPEPLISAVLSAALLDDEWRERHIGGEKLVLPVWQESRDAAGPTNTLTVSGGKITGKRSHVLMAKGADAFLAIDTSGAWLVQADAPGVQVEVLETQDGGHYGVVSFNSAAAQPMEAHAADAFADANVATSAYLLGMMDAALERTLDYLKTRVQFGKVIGSFQALQHRAVELKLQTELTRASVEDAARRWDREPGTPDSYAAISRAKARAASAVMFVTRQAIQLHGGIGYSDEHDIGLYLRKAMVIAPQFGTAEFHKAKFRKLTAGEISA